MIKVIKSLSAVIFIIIFTLGSQIQAVAATEGAKDSTPAILSKGAVVFDSARGQTLYKSGLKDKASLPIASDILTLLIAVDKIKLDSKIMIPNEIRAADSNNVLFDQGAKYNADELLLTLILSPTPAVSEAVANNISGSTESFVKLMNERAKLLGIDASFTSPSSYNSKDLKLSIDDFSKLIKAAVNNPIIDSYLGTSAKPWTSEETTHVLINPNKLFWMGLDGINGGAYQSLDNSGDSITVATRDGQKLIAVVVGGKGNDAFTDTTNLMNFCFSKFNKSLLVAKDTVLHEITFSGETLPLASMEDVYYTHPVGNSYIKNLDFNIKEDIKTPISENTVLGTARYTLSDDTNIEVNLYSKVNLTARKNILNELTARLLDNRDVLYLIVILCITEIFLIAFKVRDKMTKTKKILH